MSASKNNSIEVELSKNGSNLYIFFGGISAGIGIPIFEFYNAAKIIDENKIFVRDFSQSWYQGGLSEISSDINSTATYLLEFRVQSVVGPNKKWNLLVKFLCEKKIIQRVPRNSIPKSDLPTIRDYGLGGCTVDFRAC